MNWEEMIEALKRKFAPTEFRVPFTHWSEVLRRIESQFVKKQDSTYRFTNWADQFKHPTLIRVLSKEVVGIEIDKLDQESNYWVVILRDNHPTAKHWLFDCKPVALSALLHISPASFCIVDKKYQWITYFKDNGGSEVALIKSGKIQTPFDNLY